MARLIIINICEEYTWYILSTCINIYVIAIYNCTIITNLNLLWFGPYKLTEASTVLINNKEITSWRNSWYIIKSSRISEHALLNLTLIIIETYFNITQGNRPVIHSIHRSSIYTAINLSRNMNRKANLCDITFTWQNRYTFKPRNPCRVLQALRIKQDITKP